MSTAGGRAIQIGDSDIEVTGMAPLSTYRLSIMNAIPEEFPYSDTRALWVQAAAAGEEARTRLFSKLGSTAFNNWFTELPAVNKLWTCFTWLSFIAYSIVGLQVQATEHRDRLSGRN